MKNAILLRLQNQPAALQSLLFGLTEQEIAARPHPDKWSIFENLAHLGRYHEIFAQRIELIKAGKNPLFQQYRADDDPGFFEWCQKTQATLMLHFNNNRQALNSHLQTLSPAQLACTARHPVYGLLNIEGWTEFFLLHEAHHFFTIFKLGAKLQPNRVIGLMDV